jgi:prepilin-type N-terminal cleavage/methylation domain-containing protein
MLQGAGMKATAFAKSIAPVRLPSTMFEALNAVRPAGACPSIVRARSAGFTLVELVVVTCILAILSGLMLGGMQNAARASRRDTTKFIIQKLNDALLDRWEQYEDLAVQMNPTTPAQLASLRARIREEMPDSWADVPSSSTTALTPAGQCYADYKNTPSSPSAAYAGAECLYMIITQSGMFPDFLEHIRAERIGDIDQDGKFEFWDGWRRPISFIRWAPGFSSPLQEQNAVTSHDPIDPNNVDNTAFALFPLIFSPGPDEALNDPLSSSASGYGLVSVAEQGWPDAALGVTNGSSPCTYTPPGAGAVVGTPDPANLDAYRDNITNHTLLTR